MNGWLSVDFLVGALLLVFGLVLVFMGLRFWFVMLPILGFFSGVSAGVTLMYWLFDEGLFATVLGVAVGIVIGLVFAALSYAFWYIGALLGAAYIGAVAGAGLMEAIGVDSDFLIATAAIMLGIAFVLIAILVWLPIYMVIITTAIAGATWAVGGAMLVLNVIDRADLGYGVVSAALSESVFWFVVWFVLSVIGILIQISTMPQVVLPAGKWVRADTGSRQPAY